jgi:hypothetical protein
MYETMRRERIYFLYLGSFIERVHPVVPWYPAWGIKKAARSGAAEVDRQFEGF